MNSKITINRNRENRRPADIFLVLLGWIVNPLVLRVIRNRNTYLQIAKDTPVNAEWRKYAPDKPMRFNRRFQEIFIRIENCRHRIDEPGLILADGTTVKPEIQIIDEFGNSYHLRSGSYSVSPEGPESNYMLVSRAGYRGDLPKDRCYKSILIRADKPFQCSEIVWHNYNLK